jgi:hypothetical protein
MHPALKHRETPQIFTLRIRSALPMTDTEKKLMAAASIIGLNSRPKAGYSTPTAIGTPTELYTKAKKDSV